MTIIPFDKIDGTGNHRQFQTSQVAGGNQVESVGLGDGDTGGRVVRVGDHKPDGGLLTTTDYDLLAAALSKLKAADGVSFDTWRVGGADGAPATGIAAVGGMVLQPAVTTITSTVAALSATATLTTASTANFYVNAPIILEPGTARAETARITAVVTNTSIAVTFPASGALYTHTASFPAMTGIMNAVRQAPGGVGVMAVSSDGSKPTYRTGAVAQTLFSTTAAVLVEIQGSANFTIRVKKFELWAQAATKFFAEITMLRCTGVSAGTPAASITTGVGKHDTSDANGPATINYYTATAAAGAGAVVTGAQPLSTVVPSATCPMIKTSWDFTQNTDKALILRGTGDVVEWFNNTTVLGAGTYGFMIEYESDLS